MPILAICLGIVLAVLATPPECQPVLMAWWEGAGGPGVPAPAEARALADFDADGDLDLEDLAELQRRWPHCHK